MKNNHHFHLAGWFGAKDVPPEPFPPGNQDITEEDHPSATDPYDVVKAAVFSDPYYGEAWGGPERMLLPIYKQTLGSLLRGLFPLGKRVVPVDAPATGRELAPAVGRPAVR